MCPSAVPDNTWYPAPSPPPASHHRPSNWLLGWPRSLKSQLVLRMAGKLLVRWTVRLAGTELCRLAGNFPPAQPPGCMPSLLRSGRRSSSTPTYRNQSRDEVYLAQ
eukprot:2618994-Prymnesium_polylepis.1